MPKTNQKRYDGGMHKGTGPANREEGAVAIFTAIFFLLLVSVITIGFLRVMLQEQSQATDNDLSQSALNSAQAGVEDAKRVIKWYGDNCPANGDCSDVQTALASSMVSCDAIYDSGKVQDNVGGFDNILPDNAGVQVSGDGSFNQAYTCLSVRMNTPNVPGTAKEGKSEIIPLKAVGPFNTVKLRWYSSKDTSGTNAQLTTGSMGFSSKAAWPAYRPSVMRVELIRHPANNFKLSDVSGQTLFLYPNRKVATDSLAFSDDIRTPPENTQLNPKLASCSNSVRPGSMYYCEVDLRRDGSLSLFSPTDTYYLRITSLYKNADYDLSLYASGTPVEFNGVQPIVDVTGRANNVFRRMQVGVRADVNAIFPENAVETAQQLCKTFRVTSSESDFNGASCAPSP